MTQKFWCRGVRLRLAGVVLGGAITSLSNAFAFGGTVLAQVVPDSQIVPDNTLGVDNNSRVESSPDGTDTISGGATQGSNLFHSFDSFSIPNGRTASFANETNIQNILTRVTGSSRSEIDGLMRANGTANLFLLNPNGIIFGQNAQLLIGGSFIASTARSINFADGTEFSATPGSSTPLLTVSVPLGLQFGTGAGEIVNRANNLLGFQVDAGKTLGLIGGNVSLDGGQLFAINGRIELGAVAAPGVVGLNTDNGILRLSFPTDLALADISLTNGASANALSNYDGRGSISVNARNLNLAGSSTLVAGILEGTVDSQAGNIEINARDTVTVDGTSSSTASSAIINATLGLGNAGDISITTSSLNIIGNAQIGSITNGQGNAGNVDIRARDRVTITGAISGIVSGVLEEGTGNGANVNIETGSLSLSDGAELEASTRGQGNAGNIQISATDSVSVSGGSLLRAISAGRGNAGDVTINAGDRVSFDGIGTNGLPSAVATSLTAIPEFQGDRRGGDIEINAGSLSLTNGATLGTSTLGQGDAGNIRVNVTDSVSVNNGAFLQANSFSAGNAGNVTINAGGRVSFDGARPDGVIRSGVFTALGENSGFEGERRGGDIQINARSLSMTNNANLGASTLGQGDAGNIQISVTDSVSIDRGASLQAFSASTGNAGNVTINAGDRVSFDGVGSDGIASGIFSFLGEIPEFNGDRRGGDIRISARSLSLSNGAYLQTSTAGLGNAGNVTIDVRDDATFTGVERGLRSGIFTSVESTGIGNGGDVKLAVGTLSLRNGGQVNAVSNGRGDAGDIAINAANGIVIDGFNQGFPSAIGSSVENGGTGKGGNINIEIENGSLSLSNSGLISASTLSGQGDAGIIDIKARNIYLDDGNSSNRGGILATSASGNGGDIRLQASKSLRLRNDSRISTSAGTGEQPGDGGNITIDSPLVIANFGGNNDITANAFRGRGGRIEINAETIIGLTPRNRQELQSLLGTDTPTANDFLSALDNLNSNDVAAISLSDPALSGTVSFNAADIDPSRDLVELPAGLVDASGLIAAGCPSGAENRFAVIGRGGLPPAPGDKLSPEALLSDWASLPTSETSNRGTVEKTIPTADRTPSTPVETIVEATSWQFDRDGNTLLTATPQATARGYGVPANTCHGS